MAEIRYKAKCSWKSCIKVEKCIKPKHVYEFILLDLAGMELIFLMAASMVLSCVFVTKAVLITQMFGLLMSNCVCTASRLLGFWFLGGFFPHSAPPSE